MKPLRLIPILALFLLSGCLAQEYPGIVVGNPEVDGETPPPTAPGERPVIDAPNPTGGSYQPTAPSTPPASGEDPAASGSIDKEPEEETEADAGDQDVPGTDRMGPVSPEPEAPPSPPSRSEHAELPQGGENSLINGF